MQWLTIEQQSNTRRAYSNGLLFVASFIFVRPFVVLVYTFVERDLADQTSLSPVTGYVTTETWACAAIGEGGLTDVGSLCRQLRMARYLLIPVVVLATIMLSLVAWLRIRKSREQKPAQAV
jgi:hypothetical protein